MGKGSKRDSRAAPRLRLVRPLNRKEMFMRLLEIILRPDLPLAKLSAILQAAERIAAEPEEEE